MTAQTMPTKDVYYAKVGIRLGNDYLSFNGRVYALTDVLVTGIREVPAIYRYQPLGLRVWLIRGLILAVVGLLNLPWVYWLGIPIVIFIFYLIEKRLPQPKDYILTLTTPYGLLETSATQDKVYLMVLSDAIKRMQQQKPSVASNHNR